MKKRIPSNKILISIPFWEGDRHFAIMVARLLADIQPYHSEDFDLLLVSRFDCPSVDEATIKHVSRKFNVLTHRSKRRDTGWPLGCNGIFFGSLEYIYHKTNAGQIPGYKAIFNCAADTVPLTNECFGYLHREWEALSHKGVTFAGALVPDGGKEHINGDATLFSGDPKYLKWLAVTVGGMRARVGWDFGLARDFRARGWANLPGIRSFWGTPSMSKADIAAQAKGGVVWMHGIKDDSALKWSRENIV